MVDLGNRLTTKLLDVGTTSMTIYVEWPLDIEIDYGRFSLMGKLDIEERGWNSLGCLEVDPAQGNATLEILYDEMAWYYSELFKDFEKKAFFAVRVPIPKDWSMGITRGRYEEDDETDVLEEDERYWRAWVETRVAELKQAEQGGAQASPPSREESAGNVATASLPSAEDETQRLEAVATIDTPPNRLWLYLAILPLILAILYFMRKKKT